MSLAANIMGIFGFEKTKNPHNAPFVSEFFFSFSLFALSCVWQAAFPFWLLSSFTLLQPGSLSPALLTVLLVLDHGSQSSSCQFGLEGLVHLFALLRCEVVFPVPHLACRDKKYDVSELLISHFLTLSRVST